MGDMPGRCLALSTDFQSVLTSRSPGRFLVEQMLKMLFAHMVTKYDLELLPGRPANLVLGPINVPPPQLTIKIRRRSAGEEAYEK